MYRFEARLKGWGPVGVGQAGGAVASVVFKPDFFDKTTRFFRETSFFREKHHFFRKTFGCHDNALVTYERLNVPKRESRNYDIRQNLRSKRTVVLPGFLGCNLLLRRRAMKISADSG